MDFLPLTINMDQVYAGFIKRFCAAVVDILVLMPFMFITYYAESISIPLAMTSIVIVSLIYSAYFIYFHYKLGATLGKMAVGIKVTFPNGCKTGLKQAILRSLVDVIFALIMIVAQLIAVSNADSEIYLNAGWMERVKYIVSLCPSWYDMVNIISQVWAWSELIILLFNKRKRALHDLIAGTVVIKSIHAKSTASSDPDTSSRI